MLQAGEKVIVWDPDVQDMYTAQVVQAESNELRVNPLVRIVSMICYPMQHATMAPDHASETSPIPMGTVCRLKLICHGWLCFDRGYHEAIADARGHLMESILQRVEQYGNRLYSVTTAAARGEYDILMRHEKGKFAPRTLMCDDGAVVIRAASLEEMEGG